MDSKKSRKLSSNCVAARTISARSESFVFGITPPFIPEQLGHLRQMLDMEFVDFNVQRRISFLATNSIGTFAPIVESVNMATDCQFPVTGSLQPVFMANNL